MEKFIGRVTQDAKINTLKDERQVVNFSLAINESYKLKGSNEVKKVTTYVQCAYRVNSKIATYLIKGTLVELYGRIGVRAYQTMNGEPKATLTLHVNSIRLHGKPAAEKKENQTSLADIKEPSDDLPF